MLCRKSGGASAGFGSSGDVAAVPVVATETVPPSALAALVAAGGVVVPGPSAAIAAEAKAPTRSAVSAPLAIFTRPLGPAPVRIGTNLQRKTFHIVDGCGLTVAGCSS